MKNVVILSALFALAGTAFAASTKDIVPLPLTAEEKQGREMELAECNKADIGTVMSLASQTKKTKSMPASYTFDVKLDSGRMTKWTIYPTDPNWVRKVIHTKVCTNRGNDD